MKLKFTEAAIEAVLPGCFDGNVKDAFTRAIGPYLVQRADANGDTSALVAGRPIRLRLRIDGETIFVDPSPPFDYEHIAETWIERYGLPDGWSMCVACKGANQLGKRCPECHATGIVVLP